MVGAPARDRREEKSDRRLHKRRRVIPKVAAFLDVEAVVGDASGDEDEGEQEDETDDPPAFLDDSQDSGGSPCHLDRQEAAHPGREHELQELERFAQLFRARARQQLGEELAGKTTELADAANAVLTSIQHYETLAWKERARATGWADSEFIGSAPATTKTSPSRRPSTGSITNDINVHIMTALNQGQRAPKFSRFQWVRTRIAKGAQVPVGTLALVESAESVLVVLPKQGATKEAPGIPKLRQRLGTDGMALVQERLRDGWTMDEVVTPEPAPLDEEIALWDRVAGTDPALLSARNPERVAAMALEPGCRVVVDTDHELLGGRSGFITHIRDADEGQEDYVAVVRSSILGTPLAQSDPDIYAQLAAKDSVIAVEDFEVPLKHLKLHLFSSPRCVKLLDRVIVAQGEFKRETGRVCHIDWMGPEEAEVSIVVEQGCERRVGMWQILRYFLPGDVVQVVAGTYQGTVGMILSENETGGVEIFAGTANRAVGEPGSMPTLFQVLKVQLEFAQGDGDETMWGGLTLPSSSGETWPAVAGTGEEPEEVPTSLHPARALSTAELDELTHKRERARKKAEEDKRKEEEEAHILADWHKMLGRLRDTEVIVVGTTDGMGSKQHGMKGRVGVIRDAHVVGQGEDWELVCTVRDEKANVTWQVPEKQLRHRWTGLNLRQWNIVSPWMTELKWNWWKEGDGAAPRAQTPPMNSQEDMDVQPPPAGAPEIGNDGGCWLCLPKLKGKRVDVLVLKKQRGRVTGIQADSAGKWGYIELRDALTEGQLNNPITVRMGHAGRRVRLAPHWLVPMRTTICPPITMVNVSIAQWCGRVVIIGPSVTGNKARMGEYAQTVPQVGEDIVWVQFERAPGESARSEAAGDFYNVQSLCRAQNQDGVDTKATRFY
ncbi:hypothetical protein B0H15DRAFT_204781 [Mycena belliarum]|uniref:KOW domain-containing protein n=1 Tax=Mycena belliarum TaxID=1033014 RepID=A0AAD6XW15_9AGAR|nr:hypothetical protein B0H15DRAFT_204781 [Mycena belliae]